jgi:Uma2 family endonuclease
LDHGFAQWELLSALKDHLPEGYGILQNIEWRLAGGGIVAAAPQPDVMVVRRPPPGVRVLTSAPLLAVEVLSPSDGQLLPHGISRIEGKRLDYAANGLEHYLEVESVGDVRTVRRYELCDGELAVVDVAEGDGLLVTAVPYDYEIRPSRL